MNLSEYAAVTRRPYSELLQELWIFQRWFSSRQLAFNMQAQTQTNWCWAATATSVSHYYWWFLNRWTQCRVANAELAHADCCNSPVPAACNVPWYLDRALTRTNNFVSIAAGAASFATLRAELDAGRPVGARIGWSGGGGHFMAIYGYTLIAGLLEFLDIDDPIYGKSHLSYSDFATNYQGSGTWTHTYFTKSYFEMPFRFLIPSELVLQRIREARPLLSLKQGRGGADEREILASEAKSSLGMAQRVYHLGLDSLASKAGPAPQPVALRVYELTDANARAFFDVSEDANPRVLQMSASPQQLEPFARSLAVALQQVEQAGAGSELRVLRVPALNFEAIWIHAREGGKDAVVPIHAAAGLDAGKPAPLQEAFAALRKAARALGSMDDTMGA